jgi:hypothetical protein
MIEFEFVGGETDNQRMKQAVAADFIARVRPLAEQTCIVFLKDGTELEVFAAYDTVLSGWASVIKDGKIFSLLANN